MPVVARFYVQTVETYEGSTASNVRLGAVCRGAHNAEWSSATPCGSIQMSIRNDAATAQFEAGKEYEVTFREVTPPAPGDGHEIREYINGSGWVSCGECGCFPLRSDPDDRRPTGEVPPEELDWSAHHIHFGVPPID